MEVDKQKALKATAYDFGNTSIYTGKEEVGESAAGIQNKLGISQSDIDVFAIPAKSNLANSRTNKALSGQNLTEYALVRDLSLAWYDAAHAKQIWLLLKELDTLYTGFQKAAELRYKTQATSKIELLSVSVKYKELIVNLKKAEGNYLASLQILNQYLLYPTISDVSLDGLGEFTFVTDVETDSLTESPLLNFYTAGIDVAESEWKAEKANFLPKLDLGYKWQSVDGNSGFYGWEAGISLPLVFFAQSGKTKASKINYQIANQQFEQKQLEIKASYNQQISRYLILKQVIDYYENEALPLANEQIQATNLAYRLGSIDYVQFIQNTEAAIRIKEDFLIQQTEYFELSTHLKFITGK